MNITDSLSAVSILTAILTFFFGLAGRWINEALELDIADPALIYELQRQRRVVRRTLFLRGVPVLVGSIVLWYICLPQMVNILRTGTFDYWHFDIIRTLFVLLEICLLVLVLLTSINTYRLIRVLREICKRIKASPK